MTYIQYNKDNLMRTIKQRKKEKRKEREKKDVRKKERSVDMQEMNK